MTSFCSDLTGPPRPPRMRTLQPESTLQCRVPMASQMRSWGCITWAPSLSPFRSSPFLSQVSSKHLSHLFLPPLWESPSLPPGAPSNSLQVGSLPTVSPTPLHLARCQEAYLPQAQLGFYLWPQHLSRLHCQAASAWEQDAFSAGCCHRFTLLVPEPG